MLVRCFPSIALYSDERLIRNRRYYMFYVKYIYKYILTYEDLIYIKSVIIVN